MKLNSEAYWGMISLSYNSPALCAFVSIFIIVFPIFSPPTNGLNRTSTSFKISNFKSLSLILIQPCWVVWKLFIEGNFVRGPRTNLINSVYQLNRICCSFWRSRHPLLLLGNYWVRLSKISHELSKPRPVLPSVSADNTDTRFGISRHPAKPNSIIVLIYIFQTICK